MNDLFGILGLVPSGALFPLLQWGGRTHFLLAIVRRIHEVLFYPILWTNSHSFASFSIAISLHFFFFDLNQALN
jgi:very-long-chain (3R)-3-hydroxyacyl-CoA dehydratase